MEQGANQEGKNMEQEEVAQEEETAISVRYPRVFFDITVDGFHEGRVVLELFSHLCPRTAENFRALCTGEKGIGAFTSKPLHYKGSKFFRIARGEMLVGGDFVNNDGTGGESIYGQYFEDEWYEIGLNKRRGHCKKGLLSIVRNEPDKNGSQFMITLDRLHPLDKKTIVFGRVVKGLGVVKCLERIPYDAEGRPLKEIEIANCGEILEGEGDGLANLLGDGDMYYDFLADMDEGSEDLAWFRKAGETIKNIGNDYYKRGEYLRAAKKYIKAKYYLNRVWDVDEEVQKEVAKIKETVGVNFALCQLKLESYEHTQSACSDVLLHNPDNVKALFCSGQALIALGDLDTAEEVLTKASRLQPKDSGIRKALADIKSKRDKIAAEEKRTYAKMFS